MRLRNKKTGEIVEYISFKAGGGNISFYVFDTAKQYYYNSLAELNKEWEDYEEQKEYWYINTILNRVENNYRDSDDLEHDKSIGNYFETKEEAEKAVEKLKAITRLSKCGFRFEGYTDRDRANGGDIIIYAHVDIPNNNLLEEAQPAMLKDLDLLFGGEE